MLDISSSSTIHNLLKFTCSKQKANVYYHDGIFKNGIFIHKKHIISEMKFIVTYIYHFISIWIICYVNSYRVECQNIDFAIIYLSKKFY